VLLLLGGLEGKETGWGEVELDEPESSSAGPADMIMSPLPPPLPSPPKQTPCNGDFSAVDEVVDGVSDRLRPTTGSNRT